MPYFHPSFSTHLHGHSYESDIIVKEDETSGRLNSLSCEEDGMGSMIGLASPCTNSACIGEAGAREEGEDSDGGESPPPPPPSLPPSPTANKTVDCTDADADEESTHITVEELKRWEDLGLTLRFLTVLKRTNNPSQLRAIHTSVCSPGFTLIQGPPGTGKTSTILGILNAFHIREYDRYYKMAVEVFLGEEGIRCRESKDAAPWYAALCVLSEIQSSYLPTLTSIIISFCSTIILNFI